MNWSSKQLRSHSTLILAAVALICSGLGMAIGVKWTKDEVVPVVLVKPHIGGFAPIEGSPIGNVWAKDDVTPVVLVKPGIGGFVPREGSAIGNRWAKENVIAVTLVEPSAGGFVRLRLLLTDTEVADTSTASKVESPDPEDDLADLERRLAGTIARIAPAGEGPSLIESRIEGEFTGWEGSTIFKLDNGQIWEQVSFGFTYTYRFRPKVWIIKTHGAYKMKVDGVSESIFVRKLK